MGRNLALDGSGFVNGPAVYVGSYSPSNDFPLNGTATQVPVSPVNTTDYFVFYQNISVNYGMRQPNGQVVRVQDAVTLIGTDNHTNIFFFDSPYLESCTTLTIQAPNGSFAILNIPDEQNYARAFNVITQGPDFAHIIWNFYNSTTLEIDSIGLIGTVLAPFADVTFTTGQIQGSIFANSLTGSGAVLPPSPFTPFCPLIPVRLEQNARKRRGARGEALDSEERAPADCAVSPHRHRILPSSSVPRSSVDCADLPVRPGVADPAPVVVGLRPERHQHDPVHLRCA